MLGMSNYTREYIDACRSKVDLDVASCRKLAGSVFSQESGDSQALHADFADFESTFFNNMVLILDQMFVHRLRTIEGKDGNPLNEVRCNSMLCNHNLMAMERSIKLSPTKSVLGHEVGDEIKLNDADFARISAAFFAEIQKKYL